MVNHDGHRVFYIRHTESNAPMSTHEIREAVLNSVSAEQRARNIVRQRIDEIRENYLDKPIVFLQAVPLINPESKWDVLSPEFEPLIRGATREQAFAYHYNLASYIAPKPTIYGVSGVDKHDNPEWVFEIHKTGYLSATLIEMQRHEIGGEDVPIVHNVFCDLFKAFCSLLHECLELTNSDLPYLISVIHLNANQTYFYKNNWPNQIGPYSKNTIPWPDHIREPGSDPLLIADELSAELFNAFGLRTAQS